jgi:bifunctional DNA-binding transcriptional regulator/antitoxin component of YhaV-PrlF toxin-antitoxin module
MEYEIPKTYTVRLRERGQLTLPQPVRESLTDNPDALDLLTLVQIDDFLILTPKSLQLSRLSKEFSAIMEEEGVTLADLLEGVAEAREAIWRERATNEK